MQRLSKSVRYLASEAARCKKTPLFAQDSTDLIYLAFIGTGTNAENKIEFHKYELNSAKSNNVHAATAQRHRCTIRIQDENIVIQAEK